MLKGNRGEWSEAYAFLRLAGEGRVYASDANLERLGEDQFLPILRIIRSEDRDRPLSYYCGDSVSIKDCDGDQLAILPRESFLEQADILYGVIRLSDRGSSFESPETEAFMGEVFATKLKAPSQDKSDITMQVHDAHTGFDPICGWSIKSELGNPPTLLNAGRTTNFRFEIRGLTKGDVDRINAISTRSKIKDRLNAIADAGARIAFDSVANPVFERNQKLIDTMFPAVMAHALLLYYFGEVRTCAEAVERLEVEDPLGLGAGMYEYKFKKFLVAVALGMVPGSSWNGRDDATGGYIVVTESGDVVAFHAYNRNEFEDYLLDSVRFETASTTRHDFGSLYCCGGELFINLNLQIRFI